MPELRWDEISGEWVMVAPARQGRPFGRRAAKAPCPFCCPPLEPYDVRLYPNDYPSLEATERSREPGARSRGVFKKAQAYGYCDVVLYSPKHDLTFAELPLAQIEKVVALWQSRYEELRRDPKVCHVQIFENKGATIGVTISHPHGQIYAFPYVPPRIDRMAQSAAAHFKKTGRDLRGDLLAAELKARRRIVVNGRHFAAYVPFAAHWPYEVCIVPKHPMSDLSDLSDESDSARREFAAILKTVAMKYDNLFGFSFPYMMTLFNSPLVPPSSPSPRRGGGVGGGRRPDEEDLSWRFHVSFFPPFRAADKLKFRASVETAAGSFINDTLPEQTAAALRAARPTLAQVLAGAKHRHFPPPPAGFCP